MTTILGATYLGGTGSDSANAIALDANGDVFVVGDTQSPAFPNFPNMANAAQPVYGGNEDAFLVKLNGNLTAIAQATYLGGSASDHGLAVAVFANDVFVTGYTKSQNFPGVSTTSAQSSFAGLSAVFIARLDNSLTATPPVRATYLGNDLEQAAYGIAVDPAGNVFVTGFVRGGSVLNFPGTANGALPSGSLFEAFVARLDTGLNAVVQATYLGGGPPDDWPRGIALDANGYVFVAGYTSSTNFSGVASDSAQSVGIGPTPYRAFVAKLTHGLHGAPFTANDDGDPHITTTNGVHYNFQAAGEFVALRDLPGLEIQTRQSPTSTFGPFFDGYTGLTTCVSLNTAVAVRVGKHRVTYQPNFRNPADPAGLQLRVDGALTPLTTAGLNLSGGGRVVQTGGALEIDFPDGTVLIAVPGFAAPQWFLNIGVYGSEATQGIMGWIAQGGWLPALPNGTSLGPMPPLNQRYVALNQTFANAWRVSGKTSLFDYAPGTSTATFTFAEWPAEKGPCVVPTHPKPLKPLDPARAREICGPVTGKTRNADCVFDVTATGVADYARAYLLSQRIEQGATTTTISGSSTSIKPPINFIATVAPLVAGGQTPTGTVQFMFDGEKMGKPVPLDARGSAKWTEASRKPAGNHRWSASYLPGKGSVFLPSSSMEKVVLIPGTR